MGEISLPTTQIKINYQYKWIVKYSYTFSLSESFFFPYRYNLRFTVEFKFNTFVIVRPTQRRGTLDIYYTTTDLYLPGYFFFFKLSSTILIYNTYTYHIFEWYAYYIMSRATATADNYTWCALRMIKPTAAECVKYCTGERLINDRQRCVPVSLSIVRKCLFCDRVAAAVYIMYCEHTCIYIYARTSPVKRLNSGRPRA